MTAAGLVCTSCGGEASRAGARFCDACGSPLSARDSHAEFKQVTVLFADVVGSMDLAAVLGAERLREIMTALVESSAAVVKRHGGTVDKFTGDGIMAVFGAPVRLRITQSARAERRWIFRRNPSSWRRRSSDSTASHCSCASA